MIAQKPRMAFYTFILVLFIVAVAVGCIFTGPYKSTATNTKIFSDKIAVGNIVIRNKLGKEVTIDAEYLSEMTKWTQGFTYGEKCTDPSQALMNEYYITINYANGTSVTSGIDFTEKDGEIYYVERMGLPEFWKELIRKIDRTRINISNYVYDMFNSGGSINMSIDAMDEKSYETLNFNELRDAERFATLFDDYDYIRVTNPYIKSGTPSAVLVSGDGTKEMIFWDGEKTTVMYDNGKSKQYWSAVASRNNYRGWNLGTLLEEMYDEYVYKYNFTMPEIAFSISGDAKKAASAFAYKIYREQYFDKLPPSRYSIKDYKVVNFSVKEISDDGKAVIGQLNHAVVPLKNSYACLGFGNTVEGEGEYKGWVVSREQFVLQKQEDGLWHCIGMGTGGAELP
jgi:hypothetical protein